MFSVITLIFGPSNAGDPGQDQLLPMQTSLMQPIRVVPTPPLPSLLVDGGSLQQRSTTLSGALYCRRCDPGPIFTFRIGTLRSQLLDKPPL